MSNFGFAFILVLLFLYFFNNRSKNTCERNLTKSIIYWFVLRNIHVASTIFLVIINLQKLPLRAFILLDQNLNKTSVNQRLSLQSLIHICNPNGYSYNVTIGVKQQFIITFLLRRAAIRFDISWLMVADQSAGELSKPRLNYANDLLSTQSARVVNNADRGPAMPWSLLDSLVLHNVYRF